MKLLNKFSAICFLLMLLGSPIVISGFITDEIIKKEKLEQRKKSVWWNC